MSLWLTHESLSEVMIEEHLFDTTNAKFRNFENDRLAKNGKNLNSL